MGVGLLAGCAFVLAYRYLPRGGTYAPAGPPERGSFGVIVRDKPFLLFLASGMFAWLVYVAFEVVLPVSLTNTHGLEPAAWGFTGAFVGLWAQDLGREGAHADFDRATYRTHP